MTRQILRGNLCWSAAPDRLRFQERGCLLVQDGVVQGVEQELPDAWKQVPVRDFGQCLIIPGLVDLHIHAPQYEFRGTGMDLELLEWLNQRTFPVEARYGDEAYAEKAYQVFTQDLKNSATTRACIFATIHLPATRILMEQLEATGMKGMVGKVNMDRNSPETLREKGPEQSAGDTVKWLEACAGRYKHVQPILTPRFIPSCSDALMRRLKEIQIQYRLPVQSHLSENPGELEWVKDLCPEAEFYGDAYDRFGLLGGEGCPAIMAHCVYSGKEEQKRLLERGVWIAHCPQSNMNLASGIAPVREFLDLGLRVGLGSDVAGGSSLSIFRAMTDAIQVSRLYWRLADRDRKPLTLDEVFYMATAAGGSFFGKVGRFEPGYQLDAVVLDDRRLNRLGNKTLRERLEQVCYLSDEREIVAKYVAGNPVIEPALP